MLVNVHGYAEFQMAKAAWAGQTHADAAVRENANKKTEKWKSVIRNTLDGVFSAGSRTPLAEVPAWVTLDVITGGFATGEFKAAGALHEFEKLLLTEVADAAADSVGDARSALNNYFLSEQGMSRLLGAMYAGSYTMDTPEEAALPVVAWLIQHGYVEQAIELLDVITPWFSRLRFYPEFKQQAGRVQGNVCVQDVAITKEKLLSIQPNQALMVQKETIAIWRPVYDDMVKLFLETVEGDMPFIQIDEDGSWINKHTGSFNIAGGWPCQHFPETWYKRASELLRNLVEKRKSHRSSTWPDRKDDSFYQLRHYLEKCCAAPESLVGRDVGRIRLLLARYITKRGAPGSLQHRQVRAAQELQVRSPAFDVLAKLLCERLQAFPATGGIANVEQVLSPVSAAEANQWGIAAEVGFPFCLRRKINYALEANVPTLIQHRIIGSGEVLARVLSQLTADMISAGSADQESQGLLSAAYIAFRRRRSLLLLNLEKQVQFDELPWIKTLTGLQKVRANDRFVAGQALAEMARLNFNAFPHVIVPNKLLQEFKALARLAGLDIPLVEEVASDIFMGRFSGKFLQAAKLAGGLLQGSAYARYYGINYADVMEISNQEALPARRKRVFVAQRDVFAELCEAMAGVSYGRSVAANGMIIEQQQILTTQNLASLCLQIGIDAEFKKQAFVLAQQCFSWVCQRLGVKTTDRHSKLIKIKNAAYAWRQMLFFLSLSDISDQSQFSSWANEHIRKQDAMLLKAFMPAMLGLHLLAEGRELNEEICLHTGAKRFLGWSSNEHWLLKNLA